MHDLIMTPYGRLKKGGFYQVTQRWLLMKRVNEKYQNEETFQGIYAGLDSDDNHVFLVESRVKRVPYNDIVRMFDMT